MYVPPGMIEAGFIDAGVVKRLKKRQVTAWRWNLLGNPTVEVLTPEGWITWDDSTNPMPSAIELEHLRIPQEKPIAIT